MTDTSLNPISPGERVHALDALRASALLLGVVFHSVLAYVMQPGDWGVGVNEPSLPLWWLVHYSHNFRMPVFFMLAGFFACLTIDRRGAESYARDRLVRIVLVLVALMYPIKILIGLPWIGGGLKTGWLQLPPEAAGLSLYQLVLGSLRQESWPAVTPAHLWFLYYLGLISFLFLAARAAALRIAGRHAARWQHAVEAGLARLLSGWSAPIWLALPIVPWLTLTPRFTLESPDKGFFVELPALFIYGLFFCLGWLLRRRPELLESWKRRWMLFLYLSIPATTLAFAFELRRYTAVIDAPFVWAASSANALTTSLAVLGWTGFFLAMVPRPSPTMRYLADSSYWVYLIHLPVVVALQVWVVDWQSRAAQLLVINAVTFAVTIATYHWGVRYTWVGGWLNGRRQVRPR